MNFRGGLFAMVVVLLLGGSLVPGSKLAEPRPYVQSGPGTLGGIFLARCIPAAGQGQAGAGRTAVFRVREAGDESIDRYDWFAPGGLSLGWSPIKGKVAILAVMRGQTNADWKQAQALRFALGGETLATYTNADLLAMGAEPAGDRAYGQRADFRVIGCEQIHRTNEYDFVVEVGGGKRLRFDITTGRVRGATTQPTEN